MKKHYIQNSKIKDWHEQIESLLKDGRALVKERQEMDKKIKKTGLQIQKYKDKISPKLEAEVRDAVDLGEFEYLAQMDKDKDGLYVEIHDQVEEYITALRDAKHNSGDEGTPGTPADVSSAPEATDE